jgi:hypothetical protein
MLVRIQPVAPTTLLCVLEGMRSSSTSRGEHMTKTKTEYKVESIEQYLKRGGKIKTIPYGVRSTDDDQGNTHRAWGQKKKGAAAKTKRK